MAAGVLGTVWIYGGVVFLSFLKQEIGHLFAEMTIYWKNGKFMPLLFLIQNYSNELIIDDLHL